MCESGASNRQVNWNCSLVVTSTFAGRRPETDRCCVAGAERPWKASCYDCQRERGAWPVSFFFALRPVALSPAVWWCWADFRVCLCHHTTCRMWEREGVCLQTEHGALSDAAVLLINCSDDLNSQIQIWVVWCVYFTVTVLWPYLGAVVPLL